MIARGIGIGTSEGASEQLVWALADLIPADVPTVEWIEPGLTDHEAFVDLDGVRLIVTDRELDIVSAVRAGVELRCETAVVLPDDLPILACMIRTATA